MKKIVFFAIILGIISWSLAAQADVVCLKNGNILEGVVVRETDKIVELEVFLGAKITFTEQDIAYVKKWDAEKNEALRKKWLGDREERERAELDRQQFEMGQKEKGLVKYRGQWIPQAEEDQLKTREYIDTVLREKIDRGEIVRAERRKRTEIARALLARGNWRYRQTEHFIIYYEDIMQSKIVAGRTEYHYEKIAYDLAYDQTIYWPQKCEVFIVPSKEKWQEYMQEFLQRFDHIGGFVPRTGEKKYFSAHYLCLIFRLPFLTN